MPVSIATKKARPQNPWNPCPVQLADLNAWLVQEVENQLTGKLKEVVLKALETRDEKTIESLWTHNAFNHGYGYNDAIDIACDIMEEWIQYAE